MKIASDIVPNPVIAAKSKKYVNGITAPEEEPENVITPHKTRKVDLDALEAQLSAQFGDKLQPRRFTSKPPQPVEKEFPRQNPPPAAWKHEKAKMQIEHLTANRLRELASQGKNVADVARMYNTDETTIRAKSREWGIVGKRKANG